MKILTLDSRRRCSLGKFGRPQDTRYMATVRDDGTIVLTPAMVIGKGTAGTGTTEIAVRILDEAKR